MRKEPTVAERILWSELRKLDLNIRRQVPIGPYIADFAHHASKTVIEVDGHHHTTTDGVLRDRVRDACLKDAGYRVLHFDEKQVREDRFVVVEKIAAVVTSPPTPTLPPSRGKGE
jgi:very-short-patch-repair endonuclease